MKWAAGSGLLLYFVVGISTAILHGDEVYPFVSWFLFTTVPQERIDYGLLIYEFDGKTVEPPRLYQEAHGIVPDADSMTAYRVIQQIGKAKADNQTEELRTLVALLEDSFLQAPARYELVRIRYRPLERWRTGIYQMERLGVVD